MQLRKLELRDAELMLEWMHDESVVKDLKADFSGKTIEDCYAFINGALTSTEDLHLAIADDNGEYMGTVSLKHIHDKSAEFGITVRKSAMGKGYSRYGMDEILRKGFEELDLDFVYWCVDPVNKRAVRFYDKNGFLRSKCPSVVQGYLKEEIERYIWYSIKRGDWK